MQDTVLQRMYLIAGYLAFLSIRQLKVIKSIVQVQIKFTSCTLFGYEMVVPSL